MKSTSRPLISGILAIISGIIGGFGILNYWIGFGPEGSGFGKGDIPPFVPSIIFGLPLPALIIALGAIIGGIIIIKKQNYRLALGGTIAAALTFLPFGIAAAVLVALSGSEFADYH